MTTTKSKETAILVTGATGTVGSELVKQLTSPLLSPSGIRVRAAVHSQNKVEEFKRNNRTVEIVIMDFIKPETVAEALNGIDKFFWLTLPRTNMTEEIPSNLIREAKKNGVRQIVKLSVFQLVGTIGRLHRYEEKIIEESGIPCTLLRASAFMQNFINFFGQTIKNQNAFYIPAGNGKVSFVDVRDIAAVTVRLLTENRIRDENTALGITGREALSYGQAAEILSKVIGKKISYIDIPQEEAQKSMKAAGLEDWLIADIMEFCNLIRAGNASQTTDTVERFLGRKATSFEQLVRDHISSFN